MFNVKLSTYLYYMRIRNDSRNLWNNKKFSVCRSILNVCFAYTSRDEMCTAMKEIAEGVSLGLIKDR